ncbi:MAG: hypothetical protein OEZ04_10165 [Nitrospinota bacterium]|nr:hypothetical protein [Nitrospinota bacterium]
MRVVFISILFLLIASGPVSAQNFYKCQGKNGQWYFSENLETMPPYCIKKIRRELAKQAKEKKARDAEEKAAAEKRRKEAPAFSTGARFATGGRGMDKDCSALPANLKKCKPYSCMFTTPAGKQIKRYVNGLLGKECSYVEEQSKSKSIVCHFNSSEMRMASLYYRLVAKAKKVKTKMIKDKNGKNKRVEIIDGKQMENPIAAGLVNGACEIKFTQR